MFINVQFETFFFTFLSFFIFSYFLRYFSAFLNISTISKKNLNQSTTYESGAPVFYKQKFEFNLQSYLLAIFFLLFELELFLTYPFLTYLNNISIKFSILTYNYELINLEKNIYYMWNIQTEGIIFLLLMEYRVIILIFTIFFILNLIFLFAFEWGYKGLNFNKNKYGKYIHNNSYSI
jgi:NADH:ubiquinone oxidoreductase subunit 3 (subunit A)